jgi:hypothetical protein
MLMYLNLRWKFKWINARDKIYSDAIRNPSFVPFWKLTDWSKYDEPKDQLF